MRLYLFFQNFSILFLYSLVSLAQWNVVGPTSGLCEGKSKNQKLLFNPATYEPYVAFYDYDPNFYNPGNISVVRYDGSQWQYVGNRMFTKDSIASHDNVTNIGLDFSFDRINAQPYVSVRVVRTNEIDGATVMFYDGSQWAYTGSIVVPPTEDNFGHVASTYYSIGSDPTTGHVAIAYSDPLDDESSIALWDGNSWSMVGLPTFTNYPSTYNDIAFDNTGVPYILHDGTQSGNLGVMKYNGSNWVAVGSDVSSVYSDSRDNCIRFHPITNEPYVAYKKIVGQQISTIGVKRFDGTNWVLVGTNQEQEITARFPGNDAFSLRLHPTTGIPYLVYLKPPGSSNYAHADVSYFDGVSWVQLGVEVVAYNIAQGVDIDFHPITGVPYVIVIDNLGKARLYRFGGTLTDIDSELEEDIVISPLPARNFIYVRDKVVNSYNLCDVSGRLLQTGNSTEIDVSQIPPGVYILSIEDNDGNTYRRKVLVSK